MSFKEQNLTWQIRIDSFKRNILYECPIWAIKVVKFLNCVLFLSVPSAAMQRAPRAVIAFGWGPARARDVGAGMSHLRGEGWGWESPNSIRGLPCKVNSPVVLRK